MKSPSDMGLCTRCSRFFRHTSDCQNVAMNFGYMMLLTCGVCVRRDLRFHLWLPPLTKDLVLVGAIDSLHAAPWSENVYHKFFFLGEGSAPQKTHIEPAKKVPWKRKNICTNLPMLGVPFQIWVFLGVCMSQAIDLWEKSIGGWHLQHGVVGTVCWATFCMPWVATHSGVQLKLKGIPVPHHFLNW